MRMQVEARREAPEVRIDEGGIELLDRYGPSWRALCEEGPCSDPFFRPEWVGAHLRAFERGRRLVFAGVWRDERLRALLPLVEERGSMRGIPLRRLRGAAGVHSGRFDLIHGADEDGSSARAIFDALKRRGGWDVIELPDVAAGGAAEGIVETAARAGHAVGRWESMRTPYVPLGTSLDEALSQTRSKFRANVRRRRKKLESRGRVTFERSERAEAAFLEEFYALEAAGWKGDRGTAIGCDPDTRRFYDEAAAWAERAGCLTLYALRLDGRAVAMHWGLSHGGRYFLPKPAFDERHGDCSPGQLLLHHVLEDCVARGLREFDFLGPWMEWKADWTERVRPHAWLYVFRGDSWGRALHAAKFRLPTLIAGIRERMGGG